ncbi:agrin-like isoform X1 [Vespula maculifrons]|uniref:Agrin-like isoform X1 n=1 Tax=Vespula maculifrons TaxID=7453 RepID=A0ABD2B6S0_VESMC
MRWCRIGDASGGNAGSNEMQRARLRRLAFASQTSSVLTETPIVSPIFPHTRCLAKRAFASPTVRKLDAPPTFLNAAGLTNLPKSEHGKWSKLDREISDSKRSRVLPTPDKKEDLSEMIEPCEKTYCAWGATCVVSENGKALCQCPTNCPSNSAQVCGSDDVTYTNQCHLRQASCQRRKNTRIKHEGACDWQGKR